MTDYGHALQFGVFITPSAADAGAVVELAVLADASGLDLVTLPGSPLPGALPGRLDAALGRRCAHEPRPRRAQRAEPAAAAAGRRGAGRGEPRHPQRRARRAGPRRRRVLGRDRGHGRSAPDARRERRRAGGGDRRDPRAVGRRAARRSPRRGHLLPARGRGARPCAGARHRHLDRRLQAAHAGADRPQGRRLAAQPVVPAAGRPGRGQRGHRRGRGRRGPRSPRDPPAPERQRHVLGEPPGLARRPARAMGRRADGARALRRRGDVHPRRRRPRGDRDLRGRGRARRARAGGRRARARRRRAPGAAGRTPPPRPRRRAARERPGGRVRAAGRPADTGRRRTRLSATAPWDESTRPRRAPSGAEQTYSDRGQLVGRHLIDVHDMLRRELGELRDVLRPGARGGAQRGRGALGAERDGAAAERLDARRVLRSLLRRGRRSTTASRTTRSSRTSCAATRRSRR